MGMFDFIAGAVSILLGISAAHLLGAMRDVVAPRRRDWLVVAWYAYLGYLHLLTWWSLFATHAVMSWNLLSFSLVMAVPGFLYLATSTFIAASPSSEITWSKGFERIRPWFFVFYGLFILASAVRETILLDRPLLSKANMMDSISILNSVVGASVSKRQVQIFVVSLEIGLAIIVSAARFYGHR